MCVCVERSLFFPLDDDEKHTRVRYCGVLEAVRVARAGYPVRLAHGDFVRRYRASARKQEAAFCLLPKPRPAVVERDLSPFARAPALEEDSPAKRAHAAAVALVAALATPGAPHFSEKGPPLSPFLDTFF